MSKLKLSLTKKLAVISLFILILGVTIDRMSTLINERSTRDSDAQKEVIAKWGDRQTIGRVFMRVPEFNGTTDFYFAPETLAITGDTKNEERYRGLHKIPLYRGDFRITGHFGKIESPPNLLEGLSVPAPSLDWSRAEVLAVFDDFKGEKSAKILWNGQPLPAQNRTVGLGVAPVAVIGHLPSSPQAGADFQIDISITGSRNLMFLPYAASTTVVIHGDWPNVKFNGDRLPVTREVTSNSFTANWTTTTYFDLLPMRFTSQNPPQEWQSYRSGAELLIDVYDSNERAVKYGLLIVFMTFFALFVLETVNELDVHPLQYLMIGAAEALFFLLLLSFSEQIGFVSAYVTASAATIALIAGYASAILQSRRRSLLLSGFLSLLYLYLFVVLRAEDVALLLGSLGLFIFLALTMFVTRNKNWYDVDLHQKV